jgi:hypothetical protein
MKIIKLKMRSASIIPEAFFLGRFPSPYLYQTFQLLNIISGEIFYIFIGNAANKNCSAPKNIELKLQLKLLEC